MKYSSRLLSIVIFLTLSAYNVKGQVIDDFSDGDFTNNPTWSGEDEDFTVTAGELQLNNSITDDSHLFVTSEAVSNTTWEFFFRWEGFSSTGLSSSNEVFFYLISNQNVAPEASDIQGYFVRIGNTSDEISLYRQDSDISSSGVDEIIDGNALGFGGVTASSSGAMRIRVSRDEIGNWTLDADISGGNSFTTVGTTFDDTYVNSSYAGIFIDYSSGNANGYFLDDVSITTALGIESVSVESGTSLLLEYNKEVEESSAENTANYQIDNGISVLSATRDMALFNRVTLEISNLSTNSYTLTVSNVVDASAGTPLAQPIERTFQYQQLELVSLETIGSTEISLTFSHDIDETSARNIANYSIDNGIGQPNTITYDSGQPNAIILNLSQELAPLTEYVLTYSGIFNLAGNSEIPALTTEAFEYVIPLIVEGIEVLSQNEIQLTFNLTLNAQSAEELTNYSVDNAIGNPSQVVFNQSDQTQVNLIFEQGFTEANYTVTLNGIEDSGNNPVEPNTQAMFSYLPLNLISLEVIDDLQIQLTFNQNVDAISAQNVQNYFIDFEIGTPISAEVNTNNSAILDIVLEIPLVNNTYKITIDGVSNLSGNAIASSINSSFSAEFPTGYQDIIINELFPDPTPQVGLPEAEFLELYNRTQRTINIGNFDIAGGSIGEFALGSNELVVLTRTSDIGLFNEVDNVIGVTSWNTLTNSGEQIILRDNFGNILDSLTYDLDWYQDENKEDGGYSIEQINPDILCNYIGNWSASINSQGGTPGSQNSVFSGQPDTTKPEIVGIVLTGSNQINIDFSEPIEPSTLILENFSIEKGIDVQELISANVNPLAISLTLSQDIIEGTLYTLEITNISDCEGNLIEPFSYTFGTGDTPSYNELIITEIMADPDPEVQLPQSEYLEVFNPTDNLIDLNGLKLSDERTETTLSAYLLFPKQYLLLVPSGGASSFSDIEVMPVSSWPSLNNSGETISIHASDELVFSTSYDQSWYKDSSKEDGGYSLEMVDTDNPCGEFGNWTASIDPKGGTPGAENSVKTDNPDNLGPQLLDAILQDDRTLRLIFDEKYDPNQLPNVSFMIEPEIAASGLVINEPTNNEILLTTTDLFVPGTTYTITVANLTDCIGTFIRDDANSKSFQLPEEGLSGDIILNEILFNPRSGGVDFVEIYNRSAKAINLREWQLSNVDDSDQLDPKVFTEEDLIILSGEFRVLTIDPTILKADYPGGEESTFLQADAMPSFPDSDGSVVLLDSLANEIDRFDYDEDFHFNLLDDVDGVSLERVSFDGPSNDPNNWKSAASTVGFATPGLMNSQFISDLSNTGTLTVEPKVFIPDNTGNNDFTTITYDLQNAGSFANINIYDAAGRLIRTLAQGDLLSTSGFFTWDGTTDDGNRARAGYYAIYFETFDSNGNKALMKETVVLGTRF